MSRLAMVAAVLVAAVAAAGARADVFAVVPAVAVPSAEIPNLPGSLLLPVDWTQQASTPRALAGPELQALWERAGAAYGIPWYVLGAINKIETNFGRNMGPSSAGAVGWMQFMPDTWLRWGMDATGDGVADPWDPEDAVYAAARYLAAAGGRTDLSRAVFAYNHADWYVRDVLELAQVLSGAGPGLLFDLDGMGQQLEAAGQAVAAASEELIAAVELEKRLARRENRLLARADAAKLLTRSLELRKQAVLVGVRRAAAAERVAELRDRLAQAEQALASARDASRAASFSPVTSGLLGAPAYSGDYVFPVGGGPSVVSVSHYHHDYPAADIAAPQGAPVYALADLVVEKAWAEPTGKCGIGATFRAADGRGWSYCHLSYLDPSVAPGAVLAAGAPVGLVGSTGHSTGPHLHLQIVGTPSYPQEEAWFRSFAGSAFRWQDEGVAPTPRTTSVFAVLPHEVLRTSRGPLVVPDDTTVYFTFGG
ncbi:MAG: lytic murein transglycosylase [Gaiellaceae bacterium]